jgi:hypothetical protein
MTAFCAFRPKAGVDAMWTSQLRGFLPSTPRASNGGLIVFEMAESPFAMITGVPPARGR